MALTHARFIKWGCQPQLPISKNLIYWYFGKKTYTKNCFPKTYNFFLRNFNFAFINKRNITQVSLCPVLLTVSIKPYSVIAFSRNQFITEACQLIWNANKLTDLYTILVPTESYFQTSYNNLRITHPLSQ